MVCSHPCNPFPQVLAAKESFWTCSSQFSCSQFFPTVGLLATIACILPRFSCYFGPQNPQVFSSKSHLASRFGLINASWTSGGVSMCTSCRPQERTKAWSWMRKNNSPYMTYTIVNNHKITIWLSMIKRYNYHIHILYIYIQSCFCEFQDISSNHLVWKNSIFVEQATIYDCLCIELFHSFKKKTHSSHGWRVEGLRPTQIAKPPRHAGAQNV